MKQYLDYYNVEDIDTHSVLCDCLTGNSLLWFMSYTEAHTEITDYNFEQLMRILDTEYLNPLATSKYLYEYQQMKAEYNESIPALVTRINNLATQAGIGLRNDQERKIN